MIDKSALSRLPGLRERAEWQHRIERGLVRVATVTLLELGYSARSAGDHHAAVADPPVGLMPVEYVTPAAEDRAVEVQRLLAHRGQHRALSVPDLLIAAVAEQARCTVVHVDKDFDLIADCTAQPVHRLL